MLTCGDWQVKLSQGVLRHEQTLPTVYLATVAKQDSSTFTLGEDALDNGIVGALSPILVIPSWQMDRNTDDNMPPSDHGQSPRRTCVLKKAGLGRR